MSRDTEELEQIRLALEEVRKSQERMDETSRSLREVSDLLEHMLKEPGPVDVDGIDIYGNTDQYVYIEEEDSNKPGPVVNVNTLNTIK